MDYISQAIALSKEIEQKQAELRLLLQKISEQSAKPLPMPVESEPIVTEPIVAEPGKHEPQSEAFIVESVVTDDAQLAVSSAADVPDAPASPVVETAPVAAVRPIGDIRKAFTINDRFRFRRELFAGDNSALTAAIEHLATLDTLAEADAYLSTMPWDHDNEAVSEFMEIVSTHFNGYRR